MRLRFAPVCLVLAVGGWAQQPPQSRPEQPQPITPEGARVSEEAEQGAPSKGPALLSRGGMATVARETTTLSLRPYVSALGVYDSGVGTVTVDQDGRARTVNSMGAELRFGVTGSRSWKNTDLDLDYRGSLRHYNRASFYDGMDNSLMLAVRHEATRRVSFEFEESALRSQSSFFIPNNLGTLYSPMLQGLSGNEMFNTPTLALTSGIRMIYQRTARLSFSVGGSGFLVRRQTSSLTGATGYFATGDVAYRVSKNQTIGWDYMNGRFEFTHAFGTSEIQAVSFNYAARIGRRWEFAMRAGGYQIRTQRLIQVQLDPAIAAIFGQATGTEVIDRTTYMPHGEAHLTRAARHGIWSAGYSKTTMPGNGVYLTSSYDNAQMTYIYSGLRTLSIQSALTYNKLSSVAQTIGKYESYGAGIGANIKLHRSLSLATRIDGRHFNAGGSALRRTSYRASVGFVWNPGEYPVTLW